LFLESVVIAAVTAAATAAAAAAELKCDFWFNIELHRINQY
jgi:hypothetical protein